MTKDQTADKPSWGPNDAPVGRWVGFFFAGLVAMSCAQAVFQLAERAWKMDGGWAWLPGTLCPLLGFVLSFALLALLSKKICRTSVRDLVIGAGKPFDKGLCLKMVAAVVVGMVLQVASCALLFPNPDATVQLNSIGVVPIIVNLVLCLGLLWIQTTSEEVLFRCPFLRAGGGNALAPSAKLAVWGVASCAVFMLMHVSNPEVLSQGDAWTVAAQLLGYLIAAVGMYVADVVYRTPLAGCAIHWANNFIAIALFCQAGTAVQSGSLFWVTGAVSGPASLVGTVALFIPVAVVMIVDVRRRRALQAEES